MLWVGIDTHLRRHSIEVLNGSENVMWRGQINNDKEGFNKLLEKLKLIEDSNNQSIGAIFMNPTGNYHVPLKAFLEDHYRVILVDARVSEHIRQSENLGREKSDTADASVLAASAIRKPKVLERPNHERYPVSGLTRLMDSIKGNMTRISNQIKSDMVALFPEYPFYEDIDSRTSLEILKTYATPEAINAAPMDEIVAVLKKASRGHFKMEEAQNLKDAARNSVGVRDAEGVYAFRIKMNVSRLLEEKMHLKEVEEEVERRTKDNEQVNNISGIKGISELSAAAIVSEIGDIKQFDSPNKLQAYGGKSPNIKGSGGKIAAIGVTKVRNPYLSNTVYESSISLVAHRNQEFLAVFNREIRKGKKPTQAYIVVGKRLIHHIYSIMKNNKPYRANIPLSGDEKVKSMANIL